ncbi:unnamed protein product [Rotaria sp. Silwood2]|nr:unnamed protein product [Rotaria sp. Silwood2]CAF2733773.1 unnamed protein product [Rotaria sp. Silwood2]CAF2901117.1 unnamed protein product [Rotaria sp. Silwood2]CAF3165225.1 unnamed protein product [Rotaria sp. Silwood2]CAF4123639.1 unnamed protein product [Rotaria sp. Silwood2]
MEGTSETAPLRSEPSTASPFSMTAAGKTFGSTYILVSALLGSIIPLIKLIIGIYYKGDCPIDQRIPTYMVVSGACGLALTGLAILLSITFMCFVSDSTTLNVLASCSLCLSVLATIIISIFLFIWFIIGCVWVFGIHDEVQFDDRWKSNYCEPVLYKAAFALLIITIIWSVLQCCFSCFRQCCTGRSN